MDAVQQNEALPPGWDCRFDSRTGRYYYINFFTKTTTWDDPRARFRTPAHISSENIQLQPMHGGSPYHVYPASNSFYPAQQAFQNPPSGVPSVSNSPLFNSKHQQIEMSPVARSTPHTPRLSHSLPRKSIQETSFTQQADTETMVSKINTMFPTVPETHIRMLLKKYYNREAVVISALQVEKHPLTTPGPYTPPPIRHFHAAATAAVAAFQMTPQSVHRSIVGIDNSSRTASPVARPASAASTAISMTVNGPSYGSPRFEGGFRTSPKPHTGSPKMKLRYVKGLFPKVEETIILDILANVDNNVQKAADKLVQMGYQKRDMVSANKAALRKKEVEQQEREEKLLLTPKPVRVKSFEEKKKLKQKLISQFSKIPERVILMALESVEYSEERAMQILNIVLQEDDLPPQTVSEEIKQDAEVDDNENEKLSRSSSSASKHAVSLQSTSQQQLIVSGTGMKKTESSATTAIVSSTPGSSQQHLAPSDETILESPVSIKSVVISPVSPSSDEGHTKSRPSKTKLYHIKSSPVRAHTESKDDLESRPTEQDLIDSSTVDGADLKEDAFKTVQKVPRANGPNAGLRKGPNDELLLADYLTWNGANPDLNNGRKNLIRGTDNGLLTERTYVPRGANKELCKGPSNMAKGSMYSPLNRPDVICN